MSDPFENKVKSGIKSIQRGTLAYNASTANITAVVPGKSELRQLGSTCSDSGGVPRNAYVLLAADGKSISHSVTFGSTGGATAWELTENY